MPKKLDKEIFEMDLYELLELSSKANETEIKKAYRKKALLCHPDKNPDNPEAANEFNRLKKILEILLDPGARAAYDKVLKNKKAAAVRARESDAKTRHFKAKLEEREKASQMLQKVQNTLTEEERLKRELKRLEEEGQKIIEEELDRVNKLIAEEINNTLNENKEENKNKTFRVKAVWRPTTDWSGYTEEEIRQLFYKWGEINVIVTKQKETKGTALIEYKEQSGSDMAVKYEKGLISRPIEVSHCNPSSSKEKSRKKIEKPVRSSRDFESLSAMNERRRDERQKLIEAMMKAEDKFS